MPSLTVVQIVVEVIGYLVPIICIPLAMHGNYNLYQKKHEMFIQKRSPLILFGLNFTFTFGMIIFVALQISLLHLSQWFLLFFGINIFIIWYLLLYFLIVKQWMIFFKYHWTRYTMEHQWQSIININFKSDSENTKNWFIRNNHKYGNIFYVRKWCAIYTIIGFIICTISTVIIILSEYHQIALMISVLIIFIMISAPIIIYTVIACKTPSFHDTFQIHWEGKVNSKLLAALCVMFTFSNVLVTITDNLNDIVWSTPFCVLILYLMNHVSTYCIYNKNTKCKICGEYTQICNCGGHISDKSVAITLKMILSDPNALHLFMVHLSKEFSLECLLSYIEMNQLQKYCMDLMKDNDKYLDELNEIKIKPVIFPSNVPLSQYIEEMEVAMDGYENDQILFPSKMKIYKIYTKYIKQGSEFEINIPYQQRDLLRNTVDDLEVLLKSNVKIIHLISLFEECKKEMIKLLDFSLSRYKKQAQFDQIASKLNKKNPTMTRAASSSDIAVQTVYS